LRFDLHQSASIGRKSGSVLPFSLPTPCSAENNDHQPPSIAFFEPDLRPAMSRAARAPPLAKSRPAPRFRLRRRRVPCRDGRTRLASHRHRLLDTSDQFIARAIWIRCGGWDSASPGVVSRLLRCNNHVAIARARSPASGCPECRLRASRAGRQADRRGSEFRMPICCLVWSELVRTRSAPAFDPLCSANIEHDAAIGRLPRHLVAQLGTCGLDAFECGASHHSRDWRSDRKSPSKETDIQACRLVQPPPRTPRQHRRRGRKAGVSGKPLRFILAIDPTYPVVSLRSTTGSWLRTLRVLQNIKKKSFTAWPFGAEKTSLHLSAKPRLSGRNR